MKTSYTYSPWVKDAPYWFGGQKVKGQGHGAWLFLENGFRTINWLYNQPMIMKTSYTYSPWVKDAPYWFWGQKVKGQGHGAWLFENGFRTITDSVINLWSWNFIHLLPMSQGCALLILGSKGQWSRSWRMVIWKWSTEIMVADLNLLGSVGDLYCFSNTFSMLLYVAPICCPSCYFIKLNDIFFLHIVKIMYVVLEWICQIWTKNQWSETSARQFEWFLHDLHYISAFRYYGNPNSRCGWERMF